MLAGKTLPVHVTSQNCMKVDECCLPISVVELSGRITIWYNVHIFSSDDVIFYLLAALALNWFDRAVYSV